MHAIADTGPLHYLLLLGHIDIVPELLTDVVIPEAVQRELADGAAPAAVQAWIASPPPWLSIHAVSQSMLDLVTPTLDTGERAALALRSGGDQI